MNNCKKCGALIYGDFLYCGKCGEPVNSAQKPAGVIEIKKTGKIKLLRGRMKRSAALNFTFAGIWAVLSGAAVILLVNTAAFLKASSAGIANTLRQLSLKYSYVKEGLSASYIAPECRAAARYFLGWVYAAALIIFLASGIFFTSCHLYKGIRLAKKARIPVGLDKVHSSVITAVKIIFLIFALIILAAYIFILVI